MTKRTRLVLFWAALVLSALAVGLIAGPSPSGGPAFDPRSTSGNGAKGLVLLLRQFGADVSLTADVPASDTPIVLVLSDQLSDDRSSALAAWTRAGGTLVVADPTSSLQLSAPVRARRGFQNVGHVDGPCLEGGFDDVGRVDTGGSLLLQLPPGAVGCFAGGDNAYFLVTSAVGRGRVVALGGAGMFTNSLLAKSDNSVLAADLLFRGPGVRVAVMLPSPVGGGRRSLSALLDRRTKLVLLQLFIGLAAVVAWRARRLGRPVTETVPVQIAGSELTVAVGNLFERAHRRDTAASYLRHDLRRWLGERLGVGGSAPVEVLAATASARTGTGYEELVHLLTDQPVASDADLVALAQSIESARQEVAHGARRTRRPKDAAPVEPQDER